MDKKQTLLNNDPDRAHSTSLTEGKLINFSCHICTQFEIIFCFKDVREATF